MAHDCEVPLVTRDERGANPVAKIGIFGGTFDPVHIGHLIVAEQCREQGKLDQVWFVPAARPPHKLDRPLTRFEHRVEMIALAIAGQPSFRIDELEKNRAGPSYTADTLEELSRLHPACEFWLLLGSDTIADLPAWRDPSRVVAGAGLMVSGRPGHAVPSAEQVRGMLRLREGAALRYLAVDSPLVDISSRDLRRRVGQGRSIRYMVPRAVECHVREKRLYVSGDPTTPV
jgi:nicotinate-nucleotide adenylyltransferase